MRPKFFLALAVTCCVLTGLASPSPAAVAGEQAEGPISTMEPAGCGALTIGIPEPLFLTCSVQVECADSSIKSCSGNSCSTSGANHECVTCNGVQQGCCTGDTCCQVCAEERDECFNNCELPHGCQWCGNIVYQNCIAGCTGGCS
jgi:hypothetical protein